MQLRVQSLKRGYLDVGSRRFLFNGKKKGRINFEIGQNNRVSIVPGEQLAVAATGIFAASSITALSESLKPPYTIYLEPSDGECRLIFARIQP